MKLMTLICVFLLSFAANANQSRTFSCNGTYDGNGSDFPISAIHFETEYVEGIEASPIVLSKADNQFILTGKLTVKNGEEYLEVVVENKKTGLVIINDNSQLGHSSDSDFNFLNVKLKDFGKILVNGNTLAPDIASFQCQTYRN